MRHFEIFIISIFIVLILLLCCYVVAPASNLKDLGYHGFTCDGGRMNRSPSIPSSVHSLRPADIDVIAALGDSITAGNGAGAGPHDPIALLIQYRGLDFSLGGQRTLEQHITLTSILKKFNKNLYGFSTGSGSANTWAVAGLNAAIPGAVSADLIGQAKDLIQRMNQHPEVDFTNKWKLVHIFIGGNDLCKWCYQQDSESPEKFRDNIQEAVQYLKDHLNKTIVILTAFLDLSILRRVDANHLFCEDLHTYECRCEKNVDVSDAQLREVSLQYMAMEQELQDSGIFDDRDDFTLVIQPFFEDITQPPLLPDGSVDVSFFAPDCFHFSQYGHAVVARNLWNNLIQAVGEKSRMANLSDDHAPLICPDMECPFIRTTKNSEDCREYVTNSA